MGSLWSQIRKRVVPEAKVCVYKLFLILVNMNLHPLVVDLSKNLWICGSQVDFVHDLFRCLNFKNPSRNQLLSAFESEFDTQLVIKAEIIGLDGHSHYPWGNLVINYLTKHLLRILQLWHGVPRVPLSRFLKTFVKFCPVVKFIDGAHVLEELLHFFI
jgi:hypothetical protein